MKKFTCEFEIVPNIFFKIVCVLFLDGRGGVMCSHLMSTGIKCVKNAISVSPLCCPS